MVRSCVKGADGTLDWFEHRAGIIAPAGEKAPGQVAYVGGVCSPDALFDQLAATWRKGGHVGRPESFRGFVADGARWIWERASLYFPEADQVLDIYHAGEHVASAANACWGEKSTQSQSWRRQAREMLLEPEGPRMILRALIAALKMPEQVADPAQLRPGSFRDYLYHHRHRMRYHALKQQDLPVGSGAMESAIKQLSVQRLRQPGMKWTREGADAVLRIRAAHLSGTFDQTVQRRHEALKRTTECYNTQPFALAG